MALVSFSGAHLQCPGEGEDAFARGRGGGKWDSRIVKHVTCSNTTYLDHVRISLVFSRNIKYWLELELSFGWFKLVISIADLKNKAFNFKIEIPNRFFGIII